MQDLNDKQLNIRLPRQLFNNLKSLADAQHRPVGQLLRHIAIEYVAAQSRPMESSKTERCIHPVGRRIGSACGACGKELSR